MHKADCPALRSAVSDCTIMGHRAAFSPVKVARSFFTTTAERDRQAAEAMEEGEAET